LLLVGFYSLVPWGSMAKFQQKHGTIN